VDSSFDSHHTTEGQFSVIPKVLGKLDIQPVLLHGDLWVCNGSSHLLTTRTQSVSQSGNVGTLNRRAAIFDAASYFGHNEAE
jgi:protein-ribulosamine 3-kinase